ncbi:hypothetical protein LTS18_006410 [Coniosporium uncinatum]|uniref:Uncharacterized protein n=1 Tax=Coniosporium uncinatum TaxID=93489 RepID=A0ACC3DCQ4_9PEZI|nr:hypothetical protein LTS18_006410 [Coniosporium uncinatum]
MQADIDKLPERPLSPQRKSHSEPTPELQPPIDPTQNTVPSVSKSNESATENQVWQPRIEDDEEDADNEFYDKKRAIVKTQSADLTGDSISKTKAESRFVWLTSPDCDGSETQKQASEKPDLQQGQLAPVKHSFCPILPISKFPYKFISGSDSQQVASAFFDAGKFWQRSWDLFYVWHPDGGKPLILVGESQVRKLIDEINATFQHLHFSLDRPYFREAGLIIDFPQHPNLRPRFLGRSNSKDSYANLESNTPGMTFSPHFEPPASGQPALSDVQAFKAMFEEAVALNKAKGKHSKTQKQQVRIEQQKNIGKQLKRAQCYLGLRPKREASSDPKLDTALSRAEKQAAERKHEEALKVPAIDPTQSVPYLFDTDVVIIAVDVEAWERNHNIVTEIGISTLDTRDLHGVAPGVDGGNWRSRIRSRHFRIKEHTHHENHEFVSGCAGRFEFGTSEMISLADAPRMIAGCFKKPFSRPAAPVASDAGLPLFDKMSLLDSQDGVGAEVTTALPKRNIIFLGHDSQQDLNYLQQLGYNPLNLGNLLEILDTASLYRSFRKEVQPKSLGAILHDMDMVGWFLHNAGNDAAYTMQVLIAVAVRDATNRGKSEAQLELEERQKQKVKDRVGEAVERALDELKGWSSDEGEDGGIAVKDNVAIVSGDTRGGRGGGGRGGTRGGRMNMSGNDGWVPRTNAYGW